MKPSRSILSLLLALTVGLASCNMPGAQPELPVSATPSTPAIPASGVIGGMVWHDVCPSSAVASNPIPPGCVSNNAGGMIANAMRDLDEPGVPGVQVLLHVNDCIGAAVATTVTDAGGMYKFPNLAAGSYCVTIDASTPPNNTALMPGTWSKPLSPTFFVQQVGALVDSANLTFDFAWDFQNQPVQAATIAAPIATIAAPLATQTPSGTFFVVDTPANCRSGPGISFTIVTSYPQGQFLNPVGKNADASWWYVQVSSAQNCWISSTVGHVTGNTAILPVFTALPSLTPSSTPMGTPAVTGTVTVTVTATLTGGVDTTPPSFSSPISVNPILYYPSTNCGSNLFDVAINVSDDNLDVVWLTYRFVGGVTGEWSILSPNNSASGGLNGFSYDLNSKASATLANANGSIEYKFHAKDKAGNQAGFPDSSFLSIPVQYCP